MSQGPTRWSLQRVLEGVATLIVIVVGIQLSLALSGGTGAAVRPPRPLSTILPKEPISLGGMIRLGSPKAEAVLVIYSDFQCPYCKQFAMSTLPEIRKHYVDSGLLQLAFANIPLERIHPFALAAAEAARCAAARGHFWEMHDILFRNQAALKDLRFPDWAKEAGVDGPEFETCMRTMDVQQIRSEAEAAAKLGISGTPTLLWGRLNDKSDLQVLGRLGGAVAFKRIQIALDPIVVSGAKVTPQSN